jgi:murein L,D-transpeptidase YcbB/YkuD
MRYRTAAFAWALVAPALLICAPAIAEPTPADQTQASPQQAGDAPAPAATAAPNEPAAPTPAAAAPATPTDTAAPAATAPPAPAAAVETPPQPELLGAVVRKQLDALSSKATDADREDATALKAFYEASKDEPLWIGGDALTAKAAAAIAEIKKADDWGLDAKAFELPLVAEGTTLTREQAADAEMKLSLAVLKYARHARGGRITDPSKQLSSYLDRMPQLLEPKVVLEQMAASSEPDATLRHFHPQHPQFEKLRQRYLELKQSADAAQAIVKLPKGPKLIPGEKQANVALLRKRLGTALPTATGEAPVDETFYDDTLAAAVKAFQKEKDLKPDGIVSAATRNALNDVEMPSPAKILANMEEWRWMPEDLGTYYVTVNIPEFMIRVVKDGQIIHEERVVTGQPTKQTPVFSAAIELVTIHPRWNVPESIKVRELYPSLAGGGGSFARQGLRITKNGKPVDPYSVDWSTTDIRKFDIYQPSGPSNALGVVKLSFPNKHIVYFHDTPSKGLFNETSRAFSHGCIRVRNPVKLAAIVLNQDKGWDEAHVQSMVDADSDENPIALDHKVPVHITYFTAWIDNDGKEQSAKDVYGHEKRITLALQGRFDEIDVGPDHLAPVSPNEIRLVQQKSQKSLGGFFNDLFGGF